ncbi:MAG: DUF11 domain-containing protein, partial [Acidimicrobiia bacterium]|nr:DUF11 domain-containing protein [Acidimicrobiia bacterium]
MQHARHFRSSPARTTLNLLLVVAMLAVLLPFGVGPVLAPQTANAAVPGVTQTYYLPMPADDHLASLIGIGGASTLCCTGPMETFVSVVSGTNNNSIAIDHWEDGYDADPIGAPSGTTEVYLRNAGQVISAFDSIPVPRSPVAGERTPSQAASPTYYIDGRDKIVATGLAAVTIGGWAQDPGPFHAGALAAYDVDKMGFTFESPVGENANVNNLFDYVGMMLIASEPSTVDIDADANGIFETTVTLAEGETHFINGGVNLGAMVESTGRIGAYLATGDKTATFEGRYIELFPNELWFDEYVSPVGSTVATTGKSRVYVYNPGPGTINVDYLSGAGASGTLVILEGTRTELELPDGEGTRFTSQGGEPFYATQMFGADANSSRYDWGFTLVPGEALTPVVIVPYGPGSQDYYQEAGLACAADNATTTGTVGADGQFDCNYSPLWITPLANTRVYIDLDADPTTGAHAGADPDGNLYDFHCDLTALQSRQIYADGSLVDNTSCLTIATQPSLGTGPRDLTGARVYTTDGVDIAAAWGQAPIYRGRPALDLGTAVFPFPSVSLEKITVLSGDVDGDGLVDPGDELTYQIWGTNNGLVSINGIVVTDVVPANTTYVAGSTALSFYDDLANLVSGPTAQSDDGVGTPTPLDEGGFALGSTLQLQQSFLITFKVIIDDPIPFGIGVVVNDVAIASPQGSFFDREVTRLDVPKLQLQKSSDVATSAQSGDTITYTLQVINNDDVAQTNVIITDVLPAGVTYVPASASVPDAGTTPFPFDEGGYNLGTLAVGSGVQTLTFLATVDQPMAVATLDLTNSATATSDQASHTDLVSDPVVHRSDLAISKVDLVDPVVAGGQITYELTVTNNG